MTLENPETNFNPDLASDIAEEDKSQSDKPKSYHRNPRKNRRKLSRKRLNEIGVPDPGDAIEIIEVSDNNAYSTLPSRRGVVIPQLPFKDLFPRIQSTIITESVAVGLITEGDGLLAAGAPNEVLPKPIADPTELNARKAQALAKMSKRFRLPPSQK